MSILLACITDRSDLALQAAQLISRSHVPVNIRRACQPIAADYPPSPFEIILLSDIDIRKPSIKEELNTVFSWFKHYRALRYWVIHEEEHFSAAFAQYQHIADTVSDMLGNSFSSHTATIERLIVHCQFHNAPNDNNTDRHLPIIHATADTSKEYYESCIKDLNAKANHPARHIIAQVNAQEAIIGLLRATEKCRLIAGMPHLALHLPALFRVRGFLHSKHQIVNNPDCLVRITGNKRAFRHHKFADWSTVEKDTYPRSENSNTTSIYQWLFTLASFRSAELFINHPEFFYLQVRDPSISPEIRSVARVQDRLIGLNLQFENSIT